MTPRHERMTAMVIAIMWAQVLCGGETIVAESSFTDGPDGWELAASTEWNGSLGHPGGCLSGVVPEPSNATAVVFASDAFLGDWSALDDGQGELRYDHSMISIGGSPNQFFPLDVVISGPGGTARWIGPTFKEPTPYQTLVVPIEESSWMVDEGEWAGILADVESVRFRLETVDNAGSPKDLQAIDNVRLVRISQPCPGDVNADGLVNLADLNLVLANFGTMTNSGDATGDGQVNLADLNLVLANFGADCE